MTPSLHPFVSLVWKSCHPWLFGLWMISSTLGAQSDPRVKVINDFLWARTQANNVIEYTHMTDRLKDHYRYDRKVKIRWESGRLLSFHFDPQQIETRGGGKAFEVDVVGTWKNLNDHLIGEVDERILFVQTPRGWLADSIRFGKERPTSKAVVDGFGAPKEYRDALRVLKNAMRAWCDREASSAIQTVSPDFVRQFKDPDEMRQFFIGTSNPHPAAYAIRRIAKGERDVVEFDIDLYEMTTGDPRLMGSRVNIGVKRFPSGWFVDSWTPAKNGASSS